MPNSEPPALPALVDQRSAPADDAKVPSREARRKIVDLPLQDPAEQEPHRDGFEPL